MHKNHNKKWTRKEIRYLKSRAGKSSLSAVARRLGRSYASAASQYSLLGLRIRNRKTEVGDVFGMLTVLSKRRRLESPAKAETWVTCRCECGNVVDTRLQRAKLGMNPCGCVRGGLSPSEKEFVRSSYGHITTEVIAAAIGKSAGAVSHFAGRAGLTRSWTGWGQTQVPVGRRFGLLTVSGDVIPGREGVKWRVPVRCDCGKEFTVGGNQLLGFTRGCRSCSQRGRKAQTITAWGETKTPREWVADPRCPLKHHFRIRNRIRLGWPPEEAIGRKRWEHRAKPDAVVSAWGETKSVGEWLRDPRCGAGRKGVILSRLRSGWDPERTISHKPWEHRKKSDNA